MERGLAFELARACFVTQDPFPSWFYILVLQSLLQAEIPCKLPSLWLRLTGLQGLTGVACWTQLAGVSPGLTQGATTRRSADTNSNLCTTGKATVILVLHIQETDHSLGVCIGKNGG